MQRKVTWRHKVPLEKSNRKAFHIPLKGKNVKILLITYVHHERRHGAVGYVNDVM